MKLPSFQIISWLHQTPFITLSLKSKPGPGTRREQAQASFCAQQQSISLRSWSFTLEGQFKEESPCVLIRFSVTLEKPRSSSTHRYHSWRRGQH